MTNTVQAFCSEKRPPQHAVTMSVCVLRFIHPQIKQMEELRSCEAERELTALRRKLELMEEEKRDYSDKCSKAEVEAKDLRFTGAKLSEAVRTGCTVGHHNVRYRGGCRLSTVEGALCV